MKSIDWGEVLDGSAYNYVHGIRSNEQKKLLTSISGLPKVLQVQQFTEMDTVFIHRVSSELGRTPGAIPRFYRKLWKEFMPRQGGYHLGNLP